MAKKMEAREDRLSDLPDSILIHILSLLCEDTEDSKKVVRTSVLSKRWQFLWISVPVSLEIEFPDDTYIAPPGKWKRVVRDYLNSTHRELHYWGCCQKIRKFSVVSDISCPEKFVKDFDLWVYFASKLANVEHFKLRCEGGYEFPQFAYKNTSWRKLYMQLCTELNPSANVNWSGVVSLSFRYMYWTDDVMEKRKESTCLKEFFHSIAHVEKLELGSWCIQYLSILELEGWQPAPSSWKFLQLSTELKQLNFPGICCFLQSSSDLDTLVIDRDNNQSRNLLLRYTNKDEQTRTFETHDFNFSFLHLKTIKILNFSRSVMPLVKYLLKNAVVLEKFIIATSNKRSCCDPHRLTWRTHQQPPWTHMKTQQESGVLTRSKRVITPSTRLTDFVVGTG